MGVEPLPVRPSDAVFRRAAVADGSTAVAAGHAPVRRLRRTGVRRALDGRRHQGVGRGPRPEPFPLPAAQEEQRALCHRGALPCCCGHSTEREGSLTVTTPPRDAQQEILRALFDHFDRSADHLTPEQVADMTAFPLDVTEKALRVLLNENRIEAITAAEGRGVPVFVTGVVYYQ